MTTYLSSINLLRLPPSPKKNVHIVFKIIISFIPVLHSKRISSWFFSRQSLSKFANLWLTSSLSFLHGILFTFSRWRIQCSRATHCKKYSTHHIPYIFCIFITMWLLRAKLSFVYVYLDNKTVCFIHFRFFPIFKDSWKILRGLQSCMVRVTNNNSA